MISENSAEPASSAEGEPTEVSRSAVFPIVGVGASAGGLEAFTVLLGHLPAKTGMAFVLIQHLDPTHESMLSALMSRTTTMPVREAKDQMRVEPDHVYVIPPNTSMAMVDGVLTLTPRTREHHTPIDFFFRTLSEYRKDKAIGVVLSGAGSDGTLGLEAIKAEGGITFAQDEQTAKYAGMPRSASASGNVDFVLPPEGIARELVRIASHPYFADPAKAQKAEPEEAIAEGPAALGMIFALLKTATGVDFTHYKRTTIMRRIQRRMLVHQVDKLSAFHGYLKREPAEVEALYRDLLINVTEFFRNPEVFEALKDQVFPSFMKDRSPDAAIRVWVPGCASGEEVYSLAIALQEFLGEKSTNTQVQLFGTDLSEGVIEKARAGFYSESGVAGVSPERLRRFFTRSDGGYRTSKAIREMCVFARQNLFADPPFSRLDLISCRNVLIYMDSVLQKQAMPIFHYALKPTGFLLLGGAEGVGQFADLFELFDRKHKIYSRKWAPGHPHFDFAMHRGPAPLPGSAQKSEVRGDAFELQSEFDRALLANYAPVAVVVGEGLEVLQSRGDTTPYLKLPAGKPSLNLLKLARDGLAFELRNAIATAKKDKLPVRRDGIQIRSDNVTRTVGIEVRPLKLASAKEGCLMIVFSEPAAFPAQARNAQAAVRSKSIKKEKPGAAGARMQQLEQELASTKQELASTKEYLQEVIERQEASNEELQAANEEILSANEELQSTNEELETAKEELQSTNEELSTVNDELRSRNTELGQLSNDLVNLLMTINIPVIMVGCDLRIRRLTPMAEKALRVIPSDVGRPITDIKLNVDIPDLEKLILAVIENLHPIEQEVRDAEGHWYSLQIRPYRTHDNKIDGAVLALQDIDILKRSEQTFKESSDFTRSVVDTVREPLLVLDAELRVVAANQSFYANFQVLPEETLGRDLYALGGGQWNIPQLRTLMGELLPQGKAVRDFVVEHEFPAIGRKTMSLNASEISTTDGTLPLILLAIEDITERKQEGEKQFRTLADSIPQLAWMANPDGWIFWYNQRWYEYTGTTPGQMEGWGWQSVHNPVELPKVMERWRASLQTGEPFDMVFPLRGADGVFRPFVTRAVAVKDADGHVVRWFGTNTDIGEHIRVKEALRESEERFRALVTATSDVVYRVNSDWSEMRQLRGQDFIADTETPSSTWLQKYIHPDDQSHVMAVVNEAIRTKGIFALEHRVLRVDGSLGWTFSRAIPLLDANGEIVEWFGAATDITTRKLAEQALLRSEKLAATGRMAATMAHEINNPLAAMMNIVYLLGQSVTEASTREYVDLLDKQLRTISRVATQTLKFHRDQGPRAGIKLAELIGELMEFYGSLAQGHGVQFVKRLDAEGMVVGSSGEIGQVLSNFLVNAIEATPQGGKVAVHLYESADWRNLGTRGYRISVADTGSGIAPQHRSRIFEPFFTTKGERGTGLGLWVSMGIVDRAGGCMRVWSTQRPGRSGTCFSVFLPAEIRAAENTKRRRYEASKVD